VPEKNPENSLRLVTLVGEIVAAYVSNNSVPPTALPKLMASVHAALAALDGQPPAAGAAGSRSLAPRRLANARSAVCDSHPSAVRRAGRREYKDTN